MRSIHHRRDSIPQLPYDSTAVQLRDAAITQNSSISALQLYTLARGRSCGTGPPQAGASARPERILGSRRCRPRTEPPASSTAVLE